ncbi:MAG: ATP-binding cassette domain-containing protein [Cyclobacteriaceae bacterium]|nr:ATP-binding cassette domain-containing protein [Cyclobacteriaceae bacterium]
MIRFKFQKQLTGPNGLMDLQVENEIESGKFVTVYGKSGAGKTSLLRLISGLMPPDSGILEVNGVTWMDTYNGINLKPQKRKVGVVFQDFALFPNMTVKQNLMYGLVKGQAPRAVTDLVKVMELEELQSRKPHTLSGGQKQRVALARALVGKPQILLLDEPLSALDYQMRQKLQEYLLRVHKQYELTTLLVSHDIGEIFKLSDQVLQLESGKVLHMGPPEDLFSHQHLSGKFQFVGEVLQITPEDVIYVITVLIDNHLVKVIVDHETASQLQVGDRVLVASKAFNPVIQKL